MFDISVNLTSSQFAKDYPKVVDRAKKAGVNGMLLTGYHLKSSQIAQQLASNYPGCCWSTAGVHPHDASSWSKESEQGIRLLAKQPNVVAIGECGLDFNRNFSTKEEQEFAFIAQLALAVELNMPVFLHCRDAYKRFIEILERYLPSLPSAVVHCFTGDKNELDHYLELGLYIGITGWICDERRGSHLRQLVTQIPSNRLLLETDSPYLLPRNLVTKPSSHRNEPQFLPHIVEQVAKLRHDDRLQLAQATETNAHRLFKLL